METAKTYTFWDLIKEYKIKIPIIQRDYAQGRNDKKTISIRNLFLDTLYEMISNDKESIDLDFVYGSVSKENKNKLIFTPLDGQQRLTTLFLLHWYLSIVDKKINESYIEDLLLDFTYEIRDSSKDFCRELILSGRSLQSDILSVDGNSIDLSSIIKDNSWFFLSWEKDPTINSMLNMIDAIHDKFNDTNGFFAKLIDKKPITFQFLELNKFGLTDSLYIKMNARGKSLTDFENFKAKFEKYLINHDKDNNIIQENSKSVNKIDNIWTDIFWNIEINKYTEKDNCDMPRIDDLFLNFLINTTLNFYISENNENKKDIIENKDIFQMYNSVYNNPTNVESLVKILDYLYLNQKGLYNKYFTIMLVNDKNKPTHEDRVIFFAFTQAIINNLDDIQTFRWMRVTLNLIQNTQIQNPDNFINAIKSIKELSIFSNDIYNYLSKLENSKKISFFYELQIKEEIRKSYFIEHCASVDLEKKFIKYESNPYFDGQIGFLLELSNNYKNNDFDDMEFDKYAIKLDILFRNYLDTDEFLFQRALLSKGNYLPRLGNSRNFTFCVSTLGLRAKNENWRAVLKDITKLEYIKELLNDSKFDIKDIKQSLTDIRNASSIDDFRKYFIYDISFMNYCKKQQIQYWDNGGKIFMLTSTTKGGKHKELYSYIFYKNYKDKISFSPFTSIKYIESSTRELPCIRLSKGNLFNDTLTLDIAFEEGFYINIYEINEEEISEKSCNILESIGFHLKNESYLIQKINESDLLNQINNICDTLNDPI